MLTIWFLLCLPIPARAQVSNCPIRFPESAAGTGQMALDTFLTRFQFALALERTGTIAGAPYHATIIGFRNRQWQKLIVAGPYNAEKRKYRVTSTVYNTSQEQATRQFQQLCADSSFNLDPYLLNPSLVVKVQDTAVIHSLIADGLTERITICQEGKSKTFYVTALDALLEFLDQYHIQNKSLLQFKAIKTFIETP